MNIKIRTLASYAGFLLATMLISSQAAAALSISQSPLFLTITLPPNISVLLDDSGSLQWGHVPDGYGSTGSATVAVSGSPANGTCTGTVNRFGVCKTGVFNYSCAPGQTMTGPTSGSNNPASSTFCAGYQFVNIVYIPDTNHYKSSKFNALAYNPAITYTAPYTASGSQLTTSFTAAYVNGYDTALGSINLSTSYEATVDYNPSTSASTLTGSTSHNAFNVRDEQNSCNGNFTVTSSTSGGVTTTSGTCQTVHNPGAAFYYVYNAANTGCTSDKTDDRCYTKVTVSSTSGPGGTDERQNFATWYSFYRTRNLTIASSADVAFNTLNQNYRVAWIDLHTCPDFTGTLQTVSGVTVNSDCTGWDGVAAYDNRIGTFTGTHRSQFFNWLTRYPANNGTPLRAQLEALGEYYKTKGADSPYAFNPHVTDLPEYVCRPNYAVVMTDGEWNESTSGLTVQPGNLDNTGTTLPDSTAFAAGTHPYSDSNSNTLADVAFYYWSTNLRSDLGTSTALQYEPFGKAVSIKDSTGKIVSLSPYLNPQNDPAQWPHMVTFTIGLGMTSSLTSPPAWGGNTFGGNGSGYNDLVTGNTAWPSSFSCGDLSPPCTDPIGNVYDLWHAAIDSRGEFFAADSPQDVVAAFNSIITRIQGRIGSSSAVAVNSTRLDSNTLIYQAQFNSSDWSGEVIAYPINGNGSVANFKWKASQQLPSFGSRTIFTTTGSAGSTAGTTFAWANLSTTEQGFLNKNIFGVTDNNGSLRVNYLSSDQSQEQSNGGAFRTRINLLGDIVDSNPFYAGSQDYGYGQNTTAIPEGSTYDAYVSGKATRTPVLYVGGNDGMLHAFNGNTGVELFAYVPLGVYPNLSALTDPTYVHQFYVDGSPNAIDAYFGSTPSWHTVVAGTTGAGAREVFLLDVTTPTSETASDVLYDYDGATQADASMGYTIGQATVARLNDGNWYMIWGNGYNSPNQTAVIYLYNINGASLTKFDTQKGSSSSPNGMASPAPIDLNGDRVTDAIYAGDLQGNLWKLDVSSTNPSQWGFTFGTKTSPLPLFTAKDSSGNVQPITDRPQVGRNKNGQVMVYFGTGTYFLVNDNTVGSNPPVMSFYGIIDDLGTASTDQVLRSNLEQQTVLTQATVNGVNFRVTTANAVSSSQQGWFIDLNYPVAQGERVVSDAELDNGRIIFTTLIPQGNACQFGGTSWLMELDAGTGGQLSTSPFDTNGDGKVNNQDMVTVTYNDPVTGKSVTRTVAVSGQQSSVGIIKTPGIISAGELQYKYYSGSTGAIGMTTESAPQTGGRLSWQQLQ